MTQTNTGKIRLIAAAVGLTLLAGCVATPPPPPPPPPAPVVEYIPYRPTPPGNASLNMYVPPRDINGIRQTVNYGLSTSQTVWNFRSAMNVAALNCLDPQHAGILPAYSNLLTANKRALTKANDAIAAQYRAEYGSNYRPEYDGYMTQVYNYFALPPAQDEFCDTAAQVASSLALMAPGELENFALANLNQLESVFTNFYTAYEQYKIDVAAWDARYAPQQPAVATGFANTYGTPEVSAPAPTYGPASPEIRTVDVAPSSGEPGAAQPGFGAVSSEPVPMPAPANTAQPVFVSNPVVEPTGDGSSAEPGDGGE